MYIDSTQPNSQSQNQSTVLGAPPAPSRAPTLNAEALKRAVTLNRVYAPAIGWINHTSQIAVRLGITTQNPDIWSFVQAVANWQARNGIYPSGVLGGEWHDLLTRNR
jgi:hypothetical protein